MQVLYICVDDTFSKIYIWLFYTYALFYCNIIVLNYIIIEKFGVSHFFPNKDN